MDHQFEGYADPVRAKTDGACIYQSDGVRFSAITAYLIRVEEQRSSVFCDHPTQAVICRDFDRPPLFVRRTHDEVTVGTGKVALTYSYRKKKVLSVRTEAGDVVTDFSAGNLKGTRRTLDQTFGPVELEDGVLSRSGAAVLDDSNSLLIAQDGHILPRKAPGTDRYYFIYGRNYTEAIRDYFHLTGFPPLIPRFALGNWWSRYKAYTAQEYLDLMQRFEDEKIPLTVATIDMDWHWVDVVTKFGPESRDRRFGGSPEELFFSISSPGWTGYSWNTELFPDPIAFLKRLKQFGVKITMNLHPASGCKFYEDAYPAFADYMGIDPQSRKPIRFDLTDDRFLHGYFEFLHHPHEKTGVDFWWIDWQQGKKTKIPGLDPLWALNHYHACDIARDGKRPLILSRFAGAGSHRYPLGFSGDTAQTWKTLAFQPYFTANAANIGYTWWSHDIGGHHMGYRDDELYLRWIQFGVFSPIMRLHSTSNEFMGKEPWKYQSHIERSASEALQFRHRLIPYLYSMNRRTAKEGRALCEPLYYRHPDDDRAYRHPNEYYFGSELLVCPITQPADKKTTLAGAKVLLPEGRYTDLFSDRIYLGDTETELFRDLGSIPVLAKEGAIIPLSADGETNDCSNPAAMELLVFRGNSSFTLYEDDGESMNYLTGQFAETVFHVAESSDGEVLFRIDPAQGDLTVIPAYRDYTVVFRDVVNAEAITVFRNGKTETVDNLSDRKTVRLALHQVSSEETIEIRLERTTVRRSPSVKELKIKLISGLQESNTRKALYADCVEDDADHVPACMKQPFEELTHLYY